FIMNLLFQVPCSGASSHSHLSHPLASAQSRRSSRSYPSYRRAQLSRIHVCLLGAICSAHSETTSIGLTSMGPWPYSTYRLPVASAPRSRGQAETEAGLGLLQAAPSTFRAYTARRRDARRSPTASLEDTRVIPGEYLLGEGDVIANQGRRTIELVVANTADRPIQVGSHFHFFEANRALRFDRAQAFGMRLN